MATPKSPQVAANSANADGNGFDSLQNASITTSANAEPAVTTTPTNPAITRIT